MGSEVVASPVLTALGVDRLNYLGTYHTARLRIDIFATIPPWCTQPRHVMMAFELTQNTPFPAGLLTMQGREIEMIEINFLCRRQGYAMEMLRFAADFIGQPLLGQGASSQGRQLIESAIRQGIVEPASTTG